MTIKPEAIGIIGGLGQFGKWCHELFSRYGHEVHISDLGTQLNNQQLVEKVEAVIVAVPIGNTVAVLQEIGPFLSPKHILIDLTSVKTPFIKHLLASTCEVLSIHPMFSPLATRGDSVKAAQASSFARSQSCVVCKMRPGVFTPYFESILKDEGINLTFMTGEGHDRYMSVVQGLTHFQAISGAHCMASLGFDAQNSLDAASPVYRMRLAMMGRILSQNPRLYAEIQIYNPYVREVIGALTESARLFETFIAEGDVDGFVKHFEQAKAALGRFSDLALEESNRVA